MKRLVNSSSLCNSCYWGDADENGFHCYIVDKVYRKNKRKCDDYKMFKS